MYSEEFVKYLLKYQNEDFEEKKEEKEKHYSLGNIYKNRYATVPIYEKQRRF